MTDLRNARRILWCLRYGIGDLVMETPALESLRRLNPAAHITALGARPATELLEGDPRVDAVADIQDWGLTHWGDEGNFRTEKYFRNWLGAGEFDLVLDPSHAAPAISRVIWERKRTIFDTVGVVYESLLKAGLGGVAAIKFAVKQGWGLDVPAELSPSLHLTQEDRLFAEAFLRAHKTHFPPEQPLFALSPSASSGVKQWPLSRLASAAEELMERYSCSLLLLRGPHDQACSRLLEHLRRHRHVLIAGPHHLRRVAALLSCCDLFICNDTGLMHTAAAVGCNVLALFGPTSPAIYLPPSPAAAAVQSARECEIRILDALGPSRCLLEDRCLKQRESCIHDIGVSDVLACAAALLESAEAARFNRNFSY